MFQSRAKNRNGRRSTARRKNHGAATRRLRVEGMERRLMLSATTPEATPEVPLYSTLHIELSFVAAPAPLLGSPTADGGPILMSADDGHGTSVARIDTSPLPPAQYTSFQVLNTGQAVYGNGFNSVTDMDDVEPNVYVSGGSSWQLVGMFLTPDLSTIEAKTFVAPVQTPEILPSDGEGGSIPISSVVAELKQLPATAIPAEKPVDGHSTEAAVGSTHSTHGSSSTASSIPGEWGRASVFETVGGARSSDEQNTLNIERAKSRGDQTRSDVALPLFVSDEAGATPHATESLPAADRTRREDGKAPDQTQEATPAREVSATSGLAMIDVHSAMIENHSGKVSSSAGKASESDGSPTGMIGSHDARVASVAAAMDELGVAERTSGLWRRSRVAAGVVLVLALERVAAFHTRESSRKTAAEAVSSPNVRKKPTQPRMRGGLRLDAR